MQAMTGAELHKAMHEYALSHGYYREEKGSGWYFHDEYEEGRLGDVVMECFHEDGIDTREEPT